MRGRHIHSTLPLAAISAVTSQLDRNPYSAIGGNGLPLSVDRRGPAFPAGWSVTGHTLLTGPACVKPGGGQPRKSAPADHSLPRRGAVCHEAGQEGHAPFTRGREWPAR
jgi:hypothetical protein